MVEILFLVELVYDKGCEDGFSVEWKVSVSGGMGWRWVGVAGGGVSIAHAAQQVPFAGVR